MVSYTWERHASQSDISMAFAARNILQPINFEVPPPLFYKKINTYLDISGQHILLPGKPILAYKKNKHKQFFTNCAVLSPKANIHTSVTFIEIYLNFDSTLYYK